MNDTIVAQASAVGRGAIAVIRLSGPGCFQILEKVILIGSFVKLKHRMPVLLNIYEGTDHTDDYLIDRCMVISFVGPNSYTGEDLIEIYSHGGRLIPKLIIEAMIANGARHANPGEFTERAYLNDKFDLVQAESVESLISANTRTELALALNHQHGFFSEKIKKLRDSLIDTLGLLELELDFSEEDVEFANRDQLESQLSSIKATLNELLNSYKRSTLIREGIRVAIIGKPNVGKSSLLNLLIKNERAIVTEIPGTTRDIIEEQIDISGHKFVFVDTAGIRETGDLVEKEGIRRSIDELKKAAIIVFILDTSKRISNDDYKLLDLVKSIPDTMTILLLNKSDLETHAEFTVDDRFAFINKQVNLSTKTGVGFDLLEQTLLESVHGNMPDDVIQEGVILNIRQKNLIELALISFNSAYNSFLQNSSQEFVAADIRHAMNYLSELIGEVTTEDVLGHIFAHFCIGK